MIVFADREHSSSAGVVLRRIERHWRSAWRLSGVARHGALAAALVDAGILAQGVADFGFRARGRVDDLDPRADAALDLTRRIASVLLRSWRSGFAVDEERPDLGPALASLARMMGSSPLILRRPEGFAHYAVYPEAFARAAMDVPAGPARIIGLRSIGTTLAAVAAASRDDVTQLLTLRPVGHPFDRSVSLSKRLRRRLEEEAPQTRFLVVDEGPGLSGSSFAAVLRLLNELGAAPDRIHVLPSHAGDPGAKCGSEARRLWAQARRHVVSLDDIVLERPVQGTSFPTWWADVIGQPSAAPVDLSAGAWRGALPACEARRLPSFGWRERRKLLLRTASGEWVARFAGLDRYGPAKLALARRLARAGFAPDCVGLRYGFLLERWHREATTPARSCIVARLGPYLALRAATPAPRGAGGASLADLLSMLLHNVGEALGEEARLDAECWRARIPRLSDLVRPVWTDNRLQPWEWIDTQRGLLKTDALDHALDHDLVGCQDIAWDLAGAAVEFQLSEREQRDLAVEVAARTGRPVEPDLIRFLKSCYCAYQLGATLMAIGGGLDQDKTILEQIKVRYLTSLRYSLVLDKRYFEGRRGQPQRSTYVAV